MTQHKTNLDRVRAAKGRLDTILVDMAPTNRNRSKVDALRAVVNSDEIDRRSGLTAETEHTPGLTIALDVLATPSPAVEAEAAAKALATSGSAVFR